MSKSHPRWRLAKKILTWLLFIAVIVLLVVYAKKVDWEEVWKVMTCSPAFTAVTNWRSAR